MHSTVGRVYKSGWCLFASARCFLFFSHPLFVFVSAGAQSKSWSFSLSHSQVKQPRKHMWVTTTSGSDLLANECCLSFICDWKGRGALEEQRKTDRGRRASAGIPAPPAVPMHSRTVDSIQPSSRHDTWVLTETSTAVGQRGWVGLKNRTCCGPLLSDREQLAC